MTKIYQEYFNNGHAVDKYVIYIKDIPMNMSAEHNRHNNVDNRGLASLMTNDGNEKLRSFKRVLSKLWQRHRGNASITEYDPSYKVIYLGNVLTGWAKGEGCVEKPVSTLWRNFVTSNRPDVTMKLTVSNGGLIATTKDHGLTEYWAHRVTYCTAPNSHPRLFVWVYRHEGRKLRPELRCHAALCTKETTPQRLVAMVNERLQQALQEFRKDKISRQNARLSLANAAYEHPSLPRRKILLSTGGSNYRPPLERSKSAPKLSAIEEDAIAEELEQKHLLDELCCIKRREGRKFQCIEDWDSTNVRGTSIFESSNENTSISSSCKGTRIINNEEWNAKSQKLFSDFSFFMNDTEPAPKKIFEEDIKSSVCGIKRNFKGLASFKLGRKMSCSHKKRFRDLSHHEYFQEAQGRDEDDGHEAQSSNYVEAHIVSVVVDYSPRGEYTTMRNWSSIDKTDSNAYRLHSQNSEISSNSDESELIKAQFESIMDRSVMERKNNYEQLEQVIPNLCEEIYMKEAYLGNKEDARILDSKRESGSNLGSKFIKHPVSDTIQTFSNAPFQGCRQFEAPFFLKVNKVNSESSLTVSNDLGFREKSLSLIQRKILLARRGVTV